MKLITPIYFSYRVHLLYIELLQNRYFSVQYNKVNIYNI